MREGGGIEPADKDHASIASRAAQRMMRNDVTIVLVLVTGPHYFHERRHTRGMASRRKPPMHPHIYRDGCSHWLRCKHALRCKQYQNMLWLPVNCVLYSFMRIRPITNLSAGPCRPILLGVTTYRTQRWIEARKRPSRTGYMIASAP